MKNNEQIAKKAAAILRVQIESECFVDSLIPLPNSLNTSSCAKIILGNDFFIFTDHLPDHLAKRSRKRFGKMAIAEVERNTKTIKAIALIAAIYAIRDLYLGVIASR
jgi:hypothetical protein